MSKPEPLKMTPAADPPPAAEPKGVRVKIVLRDKLTPFVRMGFLSHVDGYLRPDGLVRVDYHPERPDDTFDHVLVPIESISAMAVYR